MRRLRFLFPVFLALSSGFAQATPTDWNDLLDQDGGAAVHFGVSLGGHEPFQRNDTELFAPASTAKLFTAGALLDTLGPDYRYPTIARWTETAPGVASSLALIGSGDPSWGLEELNEGLSDRLDSIATALKAAGVTTVRGELKILASDPRWNAVTIPEGWKADDTIGCGGAIAQAFNFGLNCANLVVSKADQAAWQTPGVSYPVHLSIKSGNETSLTVHFTGSAFSVEGTWKDGTESRSFTLPVFDTRPWAAALFRAALVAKGIQFVPGPRGFFGARKQLVFNSLPLSELFKPFLKNSINMMGDAFLKTLGATRSFRFSDGSLLAPGLAKLGAFLHAYGDSRDFLLHDGSGLSRTSRVAPAFVLRYLNAISAASWFPALYAALPVAGVDGTLRNRMKGTPAEGVLHAKTGTLDGVYNLAGFVPMKSGYAPFVILTQTTASESTAAKAGEDRVGARLAALHSDSAGEILEPFPFVPEHAGFDFQ